MDSQWLKTQLQSNPQKTKAELAKALGLEPPAVSKILNGSRQIKAGEYVAMRNFFGMPSDGASSIKKNSGFYTLAPLEASRFADGGEGVAAEWVIPANILNARTQTPPEKIKIFQVRESVMAPDFKQGEYVLVDLNDTNPAPPGVFVVSDGFGHMVRHCGFIPHTNPPEVKISARSDEFYAQPLLLKDFSVIGRVIAKLHWL